MDAKEAEPYIRSLVIKRGDRLLLCTDGLTDMLSDEGIAEVLSGEPDCQSVCEQLVSRANSAGGYDNITVVLVDKL